MIIINQLIQSNILLDEENRIKIGDFGEAKSLLGTSARTLVGTIPYWSPEMINFDLNIDPKILIVITSKSDIW